MVVRKRKKILKKRGHRTAGYGHSKKHRGGGSRGGRGLAGLHKHKIMRMLKYMPDHFGKTGFTPLRKREVKTIDLKGLDSKIEDLLEEGRVKKEGNAIKINLSELGYDKLLGTGKVTHRLIVEGKGFSKQAIKKLEEADGKAVVVG